MARRGNRPHRDQLQHLRAHLQKLGEGPFGSIAQELESELSFVQEQVQAGYSQPDALRIVLSKTEAVIKMLPLEVGDRFWFDAQMIASVQASWDHMSQRLSGTIIPNYGQDWGHIGAYMPCGLRGENRKSVNVIFIPREDRPENINLLAYPFLCHELGHNLFYYNDSIFVNCFADSFDKVLGSLRLRSIADKGAAASKSRRLVEEVEKLWFPASDHRNWAHEMGMDMVALWTAGPSYLAAFQDEVEESSKNPYLINQEHPPYAVRVEALLKASEQLGWSQYARPLERIIKDWPASGWKAGLDNHYRALTDPRLVEACISCSLMACESLALPRCDTAVIEHVRSVLVRKELPDFGVELMLAAWLVRQTGSEDDYDEWEQATVRDMIASITQ